MREPSTLELVLPLVGTVVGVVLGWVLAALTGRKAAQDEREWAERQTVRQRQVEAATRLDEAIIEVGKLMPNGVVNQRDAQEPLTHAHHQLRGAWSRATVLTDPGIERGINALDMAIFMAAGEAADPGEETINFWPLSVALRDVRKTLAAYQRHDPSPEPEFPSARELIQIVHARSDAIGLEAMHQWLMDRNVL